MADLQNDKLFKKVRTEAVMVYGNHGKSPAILEDFMLLLENAFLDSGIKLRFSPEVVPGQLNVFIEFFSATGLVGELIRIKQQHPDTDYVCIPTEMITGDTFNDFPGKKRRPFRSFIFWLGNQRVTQKAVDGIRYVCSLIARNNYSKIAKLINTNKISMLYVDEKATRSHYSNKRYWRKRYKTFVELVPYFKSIWCMSDFQYEAYQKALGGNNLRRMPVVTFLTKPCVQHPPDEEKDIDFMFTGTITSYRKQLLDALRSKGYKVFSGPPNLPTFLREHLLRRTKISLDIRQSRDWTASSPLRLHQLMLQGAFVAAEYGGMACHQESFVALIRPEIFVEGCEEELKKGNFAKRGAEQFDNYNQTLEPQRKQMRALIREAANLPEFIEAEMRHSAKLVAKNDRVSIS